MVTSRAPTGTGRPSTSSMRAASRRGQGDAAGRDAEHDQVVGALVALEDLVGDAAQGPGDVTWAHHGAGGGG